MSWKHTAGKFFCSFFYASGFLVLTIQLLNPSVTVAVDKYWNVTSGDWSDTIPCPWNPSPEPSSSDDAYIENGGTATISSPGQICGDLTLGGSTGSGTIEMLNGDLSTTTAFLGNSGTGVFSQSGGTNITGTLFVGPFPSTGNGSYTLSGSGLLSVESEWVGCYGTGSFTQTGGIHTVSFLHVGGYASLANATFNLSGSGVLIADTEDIGYADMLVGPATFTQSGGTNTANYIEIHDRFILSGGLLNIDSGLTNRGDYGLTKKGVLDLAGSTAMVKASSAIIDFTGGAPQNTQNAILSIGVNSLLIVPSGYAPEQHWAKYNNNGTLHTEGSPLSLSAGQIVYGIGTITDHVNCEGTLSAAAGGFIKLRNGLTLSGSGLVNLGTADGTLGRQIDSRAILLCEGTRIIIVLCPVLF